VREPRAGLGHKSVMANLLLCTGLTWRGDATAHPPNAAEIEALTSNVYECMDDVLPGATNLAGRGLREVLPVAEALPVPLPGVFGDMRGTVVKAWCAEYEYKDGVARLCVRLWRVQLEYRPGTLGWTRNRCCASRDVVVSRFRR
jgi:hypothetical protein